MTKCNIATLLDIIKDEEATLLREKLDIHEGSYTFHDGPILAFLDPYQGLRTLKVKEAYIYREYGDDTLNVSGTCTDPETGVEASACFEIDENCEILTGEILRLCSLIPDKYIKPETAKEGWERFRGGHNVKNYNGEPARIEFDPERKTISALTSSAQGHFIGYEAEEMVFDAMQRIKKGECSDEEAIQKLFNSLELDLPF